VTLSRILLSSFAPVAERFDAYAKSVSGRTSLALPEGQATGHPACCKFSLPHPGKSAGSPNPSHFRWLIDSILPAHNAHLLTIAIGLIFASCEGKAALSSLGGYFTFRATQRTALALAHIPSRTHRLVLGGLFRPHPGRRTAVSVRGANRRNLVLRLGPLTFHPSNRDLSRTDSIGDDVPECTAHSCGSPDHSDISGRPPPVQKEDRTAGRFSPGHEKQIQQVSSGASLFRDTNPASPTNRTAGAQSL